MTRKLLPGNARVKLGGVAGHIIGIQDFEHVRSGRKHWTGVCLQDNDQRPGGFRDQGGDGFFKLHVHKGNARR